MSNNWEDVFFLSHVNIKNIIGKELINDDSVAVMELVKNSYDAGALKVDLEFRNLTSLDKSNHEIIISDNGEGMSKEDILYKWLNLAYSIKRVQNAQNSRLQAGNKGIGRFSCDRLGKQLNIFTKKNNSTIYNLQINWEDFERIEDYSVEINQIPMRLREVNNDLVFQETGYNIGESGTIIQIFNLRAEWIKIKQNSLFNEVLNYQKFSTLKASLEKLINKSQVNSGGFQIILHVKEIDDENEKQYYKKINGEIKNKFFDRLNFDTTYIQSAITDDGSQIITKLKDRDRIVFQTIEKNTEFPDLKGIKIILMYLNPYAKVYFENQMGMRSVDFGSVFLFINGFRIPPYGDVDNDSFGMEVRKNQGRNRYISNRELIGRIEIEDREEQYQIISSREGIVQNEKFRQLIHKSTKSTKSQTKNNGYFYKTLKKLEKYVVQGIRWDSTPKEITEAYIKTIVSTKNWNKNKEVYTISESEKRLNISKNIFKILGIDEKNIDNLYIDEKIVEGILEDKDKLEIEKNIKVFLKDFSKLPQNVIDNKLKKFMKRIIVRIDDIKLTKKVEILLSNKNKNKLIEESINKDILYDELDKKIEVLQDEKELLKKQKEQSDRQATLLKSVTSKSVKELIAFQHHIGLYSDKAKDYVLDTINMINDGEFDKDDYLENLQIVMLELNKIEIISKYITKKDILKTTRIIEEDLVLFIEKYVKSIYEATTNKEFKIDINTNKISYKCKFEPIKINIIIDNLLSNSKKEEINASNVNINFFCEDENLIMEYIDDGRGLDKSIDDENTIFEIGQTTTSGGSGLGMYHVKEILQNMKSDISVVKQEKGIKFLIRFNL